MAAPISFIRWLADQLVQRLRPRNADHWDDVHAARGQLDQTLLQTEFFEGGGQDWHTQGFARFRVHNVILLPSFDSKTVG